MKAELAMSIEGCSFCQKPLEEIDGVPDLREWDIFFFSAEHVVVRCRDCFIKFIIRVGDEAIEAECADEIDGLTRTDIS